VAIGGGTRLLFVGQKDFATARRLKASSTSSGVYRGSALGMESCACASIEFLPGIISWCVDGSELSVVR
jgi:hypothetical protein